MLIPDNVQPELSIYYNGSLLLKELMETKQIDLLELYNLVKEKYGMTFPIMLLSIDWLYLIDCVIVNGKGEVIRVY